MRGPCTRSRLTQCPRSPSELESVLRAYVEDLSEEVAKVITPQDELVGGDKGQLEPHGVIGGMVFAMVTRASYYPRLTWFESLDWEKVSCALRGLPPSVAADRKGPLDSPRGFEKIAEAKALDSLHGLLLAQPGDKSRVWGANSFALLPTFGGMFSENVAQQSGLRMPAASFQEKGNHSGLWLAVVDPDAAATAPGVVKQAKDEAGGRASSSARNNAGILGKLFAKWFWQLCD